MCGGEGGVSKVCGGGGGVSKVCGGAGEGLQLRKGEVIERGGDGEMVTPGGKGMIE